MPPSLALLIWAILLLGLLLFDPARESKTSWALWVPVFWMSINGSRLPSQWLGASMGQLATTLEEGNPLDRTIYSALIVLAILVLVTRPFKWNEFFPRNLFLISFLCFGLLSVSWSDFPFIGLRRWFRDLGDYLVILVVLSDPRPVEALRTVFRRLSYLLIPLAIVLVKYYPHLAVHYSYWTGAPEFVGVATSKNTLGGLCLVCGLFFFWDTVIRWPERKERRTKRIILVNVAFIAMTLRLLFLSRSATSTVCLALGCLVVAAAHSKMSRRNPAILKVLIPVSFLVYLTLTLGFGMTGELASAVGRDATLTGRTVIWHAVLSTHTNPLLGTGYESFWLGHRLIDVWRQTGPNINEAHDGYLDVYLNLGFIGLFLLLGFLIASFRTICRRLVHFPSLGSLGAAMWTVLLFYNVTEASFKSGLLWMMFVLGAVVVPGLVNVQAISPTKAPSFEEAPSGLEDAVTL